MEQRFDTIVLGAGLRGLTAGLQRPHDDRAAGLLVVDAAPRAGGSVRTQRSNGFACELGPFAFDRAELTPTLAALQRAPAVVDARTPNGLLFTGTGTVATPVEPRPVSFATGAEELVQACRRELGTNLLLAREATAVTTTGDSFVVTLGGEAPSTISATRLVVALPLANAARLLAPFDRELTAVAERLRTTPCAFGFFGGSANDARELDGYGIAAAEDVDSPLREAIFCDRVFDGRALPGRCLVRCEIAGAILEGDDDTVLATSLAELRRWTGTRAPFPFTKLHRFAEELVDGATVECRVRLRDVAARVPGLILA